MNNSLPVVAWCVKCSTIRTHISIHALAKIVYGLCDCETHRHSHSTPCTHKQRRCQGKSGTC